MANEKESDPNPPSVNAGPRADNKRTAEEAGFDVAGNVEERGEDPSPDDRKRGETSDKEGAKP